MMLTSPVRSGSRRAPSRAPEPLPGDDLGIVPARRTPSLVGGEIRRVTEASPADLAGVLAGDRLLAINGLAIRDVIDYSFETEGAELDLVLAREGGLLHLTVRKEADQELGLEFRLPVFEGIRECNNACEFCFIRGLPKGLRPSLYIRDDDYRYSFLFGTFLTLTNLDEADWERIGFQHLSPLHVSVHATDIDVRRRMLRNPHAPDILDQLERLGSLGVQVKTQVVLCPGENDGEVLDRTVRELALRSDTVDSVAVVPVGLTRYSTGRGLRAVTAQEARELIRRARRWQRDLRGRLGRDFVYLSDELYLLAGAALPPAWRYDGYRQLQNGVGLTRLLLTQWAGQKRRIPTAVSERRRVVWVCGRAAAPALRKMAADLRAVRGLDVRVLEVANRLFGGSISASGLLAGHDVAGALKDRRADLAVLPRSAFGFDGRETLDGWTVESIAHAAGMRLALASAASELLQSTLSGSDTLQT